GRALNLENLRLEAAGVQLGENGFVRVDAQLRTPAPGVYGLGDILGAHIVAAHASELIHELAVARENEYTVEEIELAVHAHPTLSEAVAEAALDSLGRVLHV